MCPGCASPRTLTSAGGSGGSVVNPAISKYGRGGGDSSKGYERASRTGVNEAPYLSDVAMSPADRYALARKLGFRQYKIDSPFARYELRRPESDSFFGMAAYRNAERNYTQWKMPPAVQDELELRENQKKKFQLH